ncbi:histidine phosphatase family protein [Pseudomonas sp. PWP3-1b2]|uniref:lipopolysaccharide core heptose(II)-phosphate phosphatase PmrG n=1 Tax=Pseudomonas sp. PWP3-1b2 TaxID=2804656 RepID=UPI003CF3792F
MVKDLVDLTLTKPRSRRAAIRRLRKWGAGVVVVGLLLAGFMVWPSSPRDLSVGDRLLTSKVLPAWHDGDVIVLVRHEERCDRSPNPCLGPLEGLTVFGNQRAGELGKAFKALGMQSTDVVASPVVRTSQTAHAMFGNTELTSSQQAICGAAIGEELLNRKQAGRNLIFVTHSGCIADFETSLGYPRAHFSEYGSALFVRVLPNGKFETLGIMKSQAWLDVLKKF